MPKARYVFILALAFAIAGCGGGGGGNGGGGKSSPRVAPQITSAPLTGVVVGQIVNHEVTATGTPTPMITATGLPPELTLTGNTISGTVRAAGNFAVTMTASNGIGQSAVQTFSLTVTTPPVAAPSEPFSVRAARWRCPEPHEFYKDRVTGPLPAYVGQDYGLLPAFSGNPMPTVTIQGPPWMSLEPTPQTFSEPGCTRYFGWGALGRIPESARGQTLTFRFIADNGIGSPATSTYTVDVYP